MKEVTHLAEPEEIRKMLVRCIRMMNMLGLVEHYGHVSARIPGTDSMLIQSQFSGRGTLTGKDILTLDLRGRLLEGSDRPPSETAIHTCIYRSREDVSAIAHTHSHYAILLSMSGENFKPVCNDGAFFAQGVPLFPHSWNIGNDERGKALADTLNKAHAVLMKGHGTVVVASCLEAVFQAALAFEKNARMQCELMTMGRLNPFSPEDIKQAPKQTMAVKGNRETWRHFEKLGEKNGVFD